MQQSREQAANLRESEARWRSLVLDAPLIVIRIDRDLQIAFINLDSEAASRLIGSRLEDLFRGENRTAAMNGVAMTLAEGAATSFEAQMELPGGPALWYSIHLGPIHVDQDIVGASLLCINVMERRRARQEREEMIRELSARNAELERFAYTASHELKTPLVTIRSFADLVEREGATVTVDIGMRGEGDGRTFFVKDNGIGIAPRFHETVFGLFDKLDPKTEGSGVGLAVVRRIVEVHGGRIWVESEGEGHGATFRFTLPLAKADPHSEADREPPPAHTTAGPFATREGAGPSA